MLNKAETIKLYPEFFRREDELPDGLFYEKPRLYVHHIDEDARKAVSSLYRELLPEGHILDFMAGWESHLPIGFKQVTGLGLNKVELEHNLQLSRHYVHDINHSDALPFETEQFDGAVCTVSVQYMTRPGETFAEIARSLKPGVPFIVTFSNRMFPSKAVLAWRSSNDAAHIRLVKSYFAQARAFGEAKTHYFVPKEGDPVYAVWAYKHLNAVKLN